MVADRIRAMRGGHWLAFYALILGAWAGLWLMAAPADLRALAETWGADALAALCRTTPDVAGFARLWVMWALMAAAMMAPTALPAFATYEDLGRATPVRPLALMAGYLAVWLGFALVAAAAQMALVGAGLLTPLGDSRSRGLDAALLAGAGLYQFSPLKQACLARCRQPLTFFMQHWDEGALRNGLRLGLVCLGCCWALMALAFVGGMSSLGFMALATVVMAAEKLQAAAWITRPLGAALIFAAIAALIV